MCGRFALYTPPARIARYFHAELAEGNDSEHQASWNVAPTDEVLGVRDRPLRRGDPEGAPAEGAPAEGAPVEGAKGSPDDAGGGAERILMNFRWGLIPWWSKDSKGGSRLINARRETVTTKSSFREAFEKRRIIVPADGYYEWRRTKTGGKQPFFFTRADGAPMAFAGLAERWRDKNAPKDAPAVRSCTIITTPAGPDVQGIHDRMPVLLDPSTFDVWLDPYNEDTEELVGLLQPLPEGTIVHHPVDQRIGNVRNNDPGLIDAV
ncbi:MAG TPA: SOS response-associated peptidase [Acidimicrobiales bacterium]|nr:SOS response-associated peptidase [Acidimicrobiales bacterium]